MTKTQKRKLFYKSQYRREMRDSRKAYKARQARRRAKGISNPITKEEKPTTQTLTHTIAKECAKQRGTSVRFMAKWLRVLKERDRFIEESKTAKCPHILDVNIDMCSFTKDWAIARFIYDIESSYASKEVLDEAGKLCAMVTLGARDVFGDKSVNYLLSNVARLIVNARLPLQDRKDLWAKHKDMLSPINPNK